MKGTNDELGRKILADSGLPIITANNMAEAAEKVTEAFKIMLGNPKVKAILVNIFGGIMRCDTIAEGVIAACKAVNLTVPLVVRMKGTNEDLGKKMLKESGLPIITAESMADAAKAVMAALAK